MVANTLFTTFMFLLFTTSQSQCFAPIGSPFVEYCDLDVTLRAELKAKFDAFSTFQDLIGKLARLIFHDCFGPKESDSSIPAICDGCIDMDNPKHAGLPHEVYNKLEPIYLKKSQFGGNDWFDRMSRADFWAACATIAIQEAANLPDDWFRNLPNDTTYTDDKLPYIPFYIGRKDCSASPDVNITNYDYTKWDDEAGAEIVAKSFGEATGGFDKNYALFQEGFGLKPREYVALLGIHTLGRVKSTESGFGDEIGKPWVEAWDKLDNEFYHVLLDDEIREKKLNWIQHEAEAGGQFEWRDTLRGADGDTRFVMLNSDMALVKDLDTAGLDATTGECPFKTYDAVGLNDRPATKRDVREFANNNQKWLNEFRDVFDRMIRAGYDNVNPVPRDRKLSILAEKWYLDRWNKVNKFNQPTCDKVVNFTSDPFGSYGAKKWEGGQENILKNDLEATLYAFDEAHPECYVHIDEKGDVKYLNYYYDWYYDGEYLEFDILVCCGVEGALFEDDYIAPEGYEYVGFGDAFIGDNVEGESPEEIMVKHILVFGISGLILILCIIAGIFVYRRYRNKQRELERETAEMTQPISPDKDKKEEKKETKSRSKKESTVDVRTPMCDLEGGSTDMPVNNPYVIANNSSIDQYK